MDPAIAAAGIRKLMSLLNFMRNSLALTAGIRRTPVEAWAFLDMPLNNLTETACYNGHSHVFHCQSTHAYLKLSHQRP